MSAVFQMCGAWDLKKMQSEEGWDEDFTMSVVSIMDMRVGEEGSEG